MEIYLFEQVIELVYSLLDLYEFYIQDIFN